MKNRITISLLAAGILGWFGNEYVENNRNLQDELVTDQGKIVELYDDNTWEYSGRNGFSSQSKESDGFVDKYYGQSNYREANLRAGINASTAIRETAVELSDQGWKYIMPQPKSKGAKWGIHDGRTTWFEGYWYNEISDRYSSKLPVRDKDGIYYGDGIDRRGYWNTGGSPSNPTELEWLLSEFGGPE